MLFSTDDIPTLWLEGLKWEKIDSYQRDLDTDLYFKEEDFDTFREALAVSFHIHENTPFLLRSQSLMMFPADDNKGDKPSEIPVLGFAGCKPGSEVPEHIKKQFPSNNPPNSLRKSEIIKSSRGITYNRWDEIERKAESICKYKEGVPSLYLSHTKLSLHKPEYPSLVILEINLDHKWGRASNARGKPTDLLQGMAQTIKTMFQDHTKNKRFYVNIKNPLRPRLFLFSEEPQSNKFFKESMSIGRGRVAINSNRIWL